MKAKYTATRLIANPGHNDTRENRLVLAFYYVSAAGVWTPAYLTNQDIYIREDAVQVAGIGGVLDSLGSNYPGYNFTAPVVAAYFNSKGREYFECNLWDSRHYVVNGHELDCGFVRVSKWVTNYLGEEVEEFTTIEVALAFYAYPHPWWTEPGNLNFGPLGYVPNPPYNHYSYFCEGFNEYVMRGSMLPDSLSNMNPLPVRLDGVKATVGPNCRVTIHWSNLTESEVNFYVIERSLGFDPFIAMDTISPQGNTGGRADYSWQTATSVMSKELYRIRAEEINGQYLFSKVVIAAACGSQPDVPRQPELQVHPNPVESDQLRAVCSELPTGRFIALLISMDGRQELVAAFTHPGGLFNQRFQIRKGQPGIYTLVLRSVEGFELKQKIIITRK